MSTFLELDRLAVQLPLRGQLRTAIHDVSLTVAKGEAVGLVGESGSGKSMTVRAVLGLLPPGAQVSGDIRFAGTSLPGLDPVALRRYRATDVAMIFQDPKAHINPVRSIGDFLVEALVTNRSVAPRDARSRAVRTLGEIGIPDGERRLRQYPHELSGGLLQRVMIASALLCEPQLILADEPTTALDVTTQEEVVAILDEQRRERGMAMVFITHDLELASAICDRTAVMYAGAIVEDQRSTALYERALHPYTSALLGARPSLAKRDERLQAIPGRPLSAFEAPEGCSFAPRCPHAYKVCVQESPALRAVGDASVACHWALRAGD
ncbi:ABC transporter ATP-binding protein [Streptomyces sp. NBC_00063]|uniref:ABC transporter ATP-binding protein n=1 Tax=Streptomyces sp. NBC_00063 TaxID=2975638 RepID=UPI003D742A43